MKLINTYKNKDTLTGIRNSFQENFVTFINKHASVFKALTRGGTPYGDNWLSVRRKTTGSGITNVRPEKQIDKLQQQLDELSQTIASLSDQVNAHKVSTQTNYKPTKATEEIGINRFRALQAEF